VHMTERKEKKASLNKYLEIPSWKFYIELLNMILMLEKKQLNRTNIFGSEWFIILYNYTYIEVLLIWKKNIFIEKSSQNCVGIDLFIVHWIEHFYIKIYELHQLSNSCWIFHFIYANK